jgi:hypothetical protein
LIFKLFGIFLENQKVKYLDKKSGLSRIRVKNNQIYKLGIFEFLAWILNFLDNWVWVDGHSLANSEKAFM